MGAYIYAAHSEACLLEQVQSANRKTSLIQHKPLFKLSCEILPKLKTFQKTS